MGPDPAAGMSDGSARLPKYDALVQAHRAAQTAPWGLSSKLTSGTVRALNAHPRTLSTITLGTADCEVVMESVRRSSKTPFAARDGDLVYESRHYIYLIRVVGGVRSFKYDNWWDGSLIGALYAALFEVVEKSSEKRSKNLKVGVLRYRNTFWGGRLRLIYRREFAPGETRDEALQRTAALVEDAVVR